MKRIGVDGFIRVFMSTRVSATLFDVDVYILYIHNMVTSSENMLIYGYLWLFMVISVLLPLGALIFI